MKTFFNHVAFSLLILVLASGNFIAAGDDHNHLEETTRQLLTYNEESVQGSLSFDAEMMYSQFCNNVSQGYSVGTGGLIATGPGMSTLMYCEGISMDMETVFLLSDDATPFEILDNILTITFNGEHRFVFELVAEQDEDSEHNDDDSIIENEGNNEDDMIICPAVRMPVCGNDGQTYGNSCEAQGRNVEILHEGECEIVDPFEDERCVALFDGCNNCARIEGSDERACTRMYCDEDHTTEAYCTHFADSDIDTDTSEDADHTDTAPTSIPTIVCDEGTRSQSMMDCLVSADDDTRTDLQQAYDLAFNVGMTTMESIEAFRTDDWLMRQEAAKMFGALAINHFNKEVMTDAELCPETYTDDEQFDYTLRPFIYDACGLGLMRGASGAFLPEQSLTKGETLAILMRLVDGFQEEEDTQTRWMPYVLRANGLGILTIESTDDFNNPILRQELIEWVWMITQA